MNSGSLLEFCMLALLLLACSPLWRRDIIFFSPLPLSLLWFPPSSSPFSLVLKVIQIYYPAVCLCVCLYCSHPIKDRPHTHAHTHTDCKMTCSVQSDILRGLSLSLIYVFRAFQSSNRSVTWSLEWFLRSWKMFQVSFVDP